MISFSLTNLGEYQSAARALQHDTKMETRAFVAWRAGIVCTYCIQWLPPRGRTPGGWNEQKIRGWKNIEHDIKRVFRSGSDLFDILKLNPLVQAHPKLSAILIRYIEEKDYLNLSRVLYKMGSRVVLIPAPLPEQHQANRSSKTGRVFKSPQTHFYILDDRKIQGYITTVQKDTGKLKSGFMPAARKLGVKGLPIWVSHKAGNGYYIDDLDNSDEPSFTMVNEEKGAERFENLMKDAIEIAGKNMVKELEIRLQKKFAKHGAHHH